MEPRQLPVRNSQIRQGPRRSPRGIHRDFRPFYEPPLAPEIEIQTGELSIEESVSRVRDYILSRCEPLEGDGFHGTAKLCRPEATSTRTVSAFC